MHSTMKAFFLAASLSGLAMAATVTYGKPQESAGFQLVAVVTNPSTDLSPSINFFTVTAIHTGAGQALPVLSHDHRSAAVWYLNGTETQIKDDEASLLTDAGTPPFPSGLGFDTAPNGIGSLSVNAGPGAQGVGLTQLRDLFFLSAPGNQGTYMACPEAVPYYHGQEYVVLKHANVGLPSGCAEIRLFPQCSGLDALPADALASHEFATPVPCHYNVEAWQTSV